MKNRKVIHAALKQLKAEVLTKQLHARSAGICCNLSRHLHHDELSGYEVVRELSQDWPLRAANGGAAPIYPYWGVTYKWEGEQLQLRLSLINHMLRKTR